MRKEILTLKEKETSIEASGNRIMSVRNKYITKSSCRYFSKDQIFSASFVGEINSNILLEEAIGNSESAVSYDHPLNDIRSSSQEDLLKDKSNDDLLPEYQKALSLLTKKFPDFIFSGKANIKRVSRTLDFLEVGTLKHTFDVCEWYFLYKHKSSPSIIDGFFGSEDFGSFNILNEVEEYSPYLAAFSNEVTIEQGQYPIIFVDSSQLFSKIMESSRADNYNKGIGLFRDKLGDKVLSDKFTLFDISYDPSAGAMSFFDADGFQRSNPKLAIIQDGVFTTLVTDSRNAHKYSLPLTGNTQRAFDSSAKLGFNTISVRPGKRSIKDILKETPKCLIVEMAAGGDFTDLGDFSTPVQNGFLVENGKIAGKLPQITLTSSVQKMFGSDLVEIASNPLSGISKCPAIMSHMNVLLN